MKSVIDRKVQYPNRYELKDIITGETVATYDLVPAQGEIINEGTPINRALFESIAKDFNNLKGEDGVSPIVEVTENTSTSYKLKITDANNTIITPNLKGAVAEPTTKNLYNLGAYDTYTSNGDGTGTVTRGTGYAELDSTGGWQVEKMGNNYNFYPRDAFEDAAVLSLCKTNLFESYIVGNTDATRPNAYISGSGRVNIYTGDTTVAEFVARLVNNPLYVQYPLASQYRYTEQVIENQPIDTANQDEELYWGEEWRKSLNLLDFSKFKKITVNAGTVAFDYTNKKITLSATGNDNYITFIELPLAPGVYTFSVLSSTSSYQLYAIFSNGTNAMADGKPLTFTVPTGVTTTFRIDNEAGAGSSTVFSNIMLNEGDHLYPYEDYNGKIVHESALDEKVNKTGDTMTGALTVNGQLTGNTVYEGSNRVWSNVNRPTASSYLMNATTNMTGTDTVVRYYRSSDGLTWYRIWSSGWKEMGGHLGATDTPSISSIAFPTAFSTTVYIVQTSLAGVGTSFGVSGGVVVPVFNKTQNSCSVKMIWGEGSSQANVSRPFDWYACGI